MTTHHRDVLPLDIKEYPMGNRRTKRLARVPAIALVATTAVAALANAGVAAPAAASPAQSLSATSASAAGVWSGAGWASTNGNYVTDVAKAIGADSAAAAGLDGTGVGIALIDTGVAPVPGLPAARVANGPDLSFDSQAPNLRYLDTFGHGTHLAGIIVGNDPSVGLRGIAPGAKLTSVKVGASGGVVDVTQVIAALNWVVAHRNDDPANPIKVVNLAYGTDSKASAFADPLLFAVENAAKAGILVVVAGGNSGTSLGRLNSPAMDFDVLRVGSVATQGTVTPSDDQLSAFTSIDPGLHLHVGAPGESIVSLSDPGSSIDVGYPGARVGTTLFRGSGSSQASAVASAAAALLYQKQPTATPSQMIAWMSHSATPLSGPNATSVTGEINLKSALGQPLPADPGFVAVSSSGLGSMEDARGSTHVVHNSATLQGGSDIFGAFTNSAWVSAVNANTAWQGGKWMGHTVAGAGWTGSSWASKTWAAATWAGADWAGQAWADDSWLGHYWSGHYWSGGDWSGHYWSSSTWKNASFAGQAWASAGWTCGRDILPQPGSVLGHRERAPERCLRRSGARSRALLRIRCRSRCRRP